MKNTCATRNYLPPGLQPIILQQPKDKLQCHKRYKTTNAYDRERAQCDQCRKEGKPEVTHASGAVWQDGVLFRTALPDLLQARGQKSSQTPGKDRSPARSEVSKKGQSVGRRSTQDAVGLSILLPTLIPPAADTAGSDRGRGKISTRLGGGMVYIGTAWLPPSGR